MYYYPVDRQAVHLFRIQAILPIYIIPFTRVNQDQLHSVIQFALDGTEICKAFEDYVYSIDDACKDQEYHTIMKYHLIWQFGETYIIFSLV